ncbi:hypothetical protein WN943_011767 [Citrus x changshan-huyou]
MTPNAITSTYEGKSLATHKLIREWHKEADITRAYLDKAVSKIKKWADTRRRHVEYKEISYKLSQLDDGLELLLLVYKGQLHTGCLIAGKILENSKFSAEEFINEVSTIGRIHYVNVVHLLGFCYEGSKRALFYEYMPSGSLDRHIFSKESKCQTFRLCLVS